MSFIQLYRMHSRVLTVKVFIRFGVLVLAIGRQRLQHSRLHSLKEQYTQAQV